MKSWYFVLLPELWFLSYILFCFGIKQDLLNSQKDKTLVSDIDKYLPRLSQFQCQKQKT